MSCQSDYHQKVEAELQSAIRNDSLILGLRFGMTSREFFGHSWDLNKAGLVTQGHTNTTVFYSFDQFGKTYEVNFYPNFVDDKIASLPVTYNYQAFAPWNPKYSLDTLFDEVCTMYKKEYGSDFLPVSDSDGDLALVRVDGNRRISIFKEIPHQRVKVLFKDLLFDEQD